QNGAPSLVRAVRRDGKLIYLEAHQRPVEIGGKQLISGAVLDVTERVRADAAEREADRRLREVVERTQFLAVQLDAQGAIQFCNDAALRVAGYTREEMLGKNWFDLCVPEDQRERRKAGYVDGLRGGTFSVLEERTVLTRSGETRVVEWNI